MLKRYLLPVFACAIIASVPVYAADDFEIMTEDQFFSSDQTEDHPALIEPAAGYTETQDVSAGKILTEDQLFANDVVEIDNVGLTNTSVPSIDSEHDY
jgi:hypothetical protein